MLLFLAAVAPPLLALVLRGICTWRFLALAALGIPLIVVGASLGREPVILAASYDGALCLAYLLDYLLSARPSSFLPRRSLETVLSLGVANQVGLEVEYRGGHRTRIVLRDEPPPEFAVADRRLRAAINAGETLTLQYTVVPPRRGVFGFGAIHLRYRGRLGLAVRQARFDAAQDVKVYPDVQAVSRFEALARVGRLRDLGLKFSRLRGTGTNFESVREYVPGDEFRWINWKATARRGKPQSNEYQIEQTQNVFILLDLGRMMVTRCGNLARIDHAINAALMLAHVAADKGDRVGAIAFGREIAGYLAPGKGRAQTARLIDFLYPLQPEMVESDYARAFRFFAAKNHKRSLVCVFTDLIDEEISGLLLAHLAALAPAHIPVCITLRDPLLDRAARAAIEEPRTVYTKAVAEQVLADRAKARRFLERRGVIAIDVPPEELTVAVVNKYVDLKERGRI